MLSPGQLFSGWDLGAAATPEPGVGPRDPAWVLRSRLPSTFTTCIGKVVRRKNRVMRRCIVAVRSGLAGEGYYPGWRNVV